MDKRAFRLPEQGLEVPDSHLRVVDYDKAAEELSCSKVELTKNRMPDMIAYVRAMTEDD